MTTDHYDTAYALAVRTAQRYAHSNGAVCRTDDLVGAAMARLAEYYPKYDSTIGPFEAFASFYVRGGILDYLREHRHTRRAEEHRIHLVTEADGPLGDDGLSRAGQVLAQATADPAPWELSEHAGDGHAGDGATGLLPELDASLRTELVELRTLQRVLDRPVRLTLSSDEARAVLEYLDVTIDALPGLLGGLSDAIATSRASVYRHLQQEDLPLDLSIGVRYLLALAARARRDERLVVPPHLLT